ncbi:endonuclease [Candidatus Shapirobacteria bacterium CG10_big_fil_rev_8_21_14_0_10_38_14]|uniref:Endonuclease n=1 Tax=Candidatus Shapirobacteria bacterium CG10_big_fil_rev_8_21_14_0_10_38_14 TaxID=1974483 RepID=A0A2M8L4S7_9BACT|nr:MAG: endonuclease [Candidatus Shapirobacteria bacterium CG10_big_fil_rev_8_21_14_0_10_38_14]
MYTVYLAKSLKNNKIYVGFTTKNPNERIREHNSGSNKWSKANRPLELIYFEDFICKADARRREKFLKSGIGKRLKKLIVDSWARSAVG